MKEKDEPVKCMRDFPPVRFMNPYEHDRIVRKDAVFVAAGEAIVIYKSVSSASGKERDNFLFFLRTFLLTLLNQILLRTRIES
jgi:hypothetical protein